MHELSIAQNILESVAENLKERKYEKVISIKLKIGELAAIDPASLLFSFDAIKTETEFKDTKMIIEEIPINAVCNSCNKETKVDNFFFVCSHCESTDIKIITGDELTLSEIEFD